MANVVEAVKTFFAGHADLGSTGIVAVSGGADSVALLRALLELERFKLFVAHVNYQLRGEESDGDEAFVRDLAATHKLEFASTRVTIPAGENLESAARDLRYNWFNQITKELPSDTWIATGHTKSDQAETLIHRIIRGTGIDGLRAICPRRRMHFAWLIRPMLPISRQDVEGYLIAMQQGYRHDSSNSDQRFTRNRIRHELMPLLRQFNPQVEKALCNLSEQATDYDDFHFYQVAELHNTVFKPMAGKTLILDAAILEKAHPFVRRQFLANTWTSIQWPRGDMTFDHWQRLANLVEGDYPGGIRLKRVGTVVQLGPRS